MDTSFLYRMVYLYMLYESFAYDGKVIKEYELRNYERLGYNTKDLSMNCKAVDKDADKQAYDYIPLPNVSETISKWQKDNEELSPNDHIVILGNGTLVVKDFDWGDLGVYKCEIFHEQKMFYTIEYTVSTKYCDIFSISKQYRFNDSLCLQTDPSKKAEKPTLGLGYICILRCNLSHQFTTLRCSLINGVAMWMPNISDVRCLSNYTLFDKMNRISSTSDIGNPHVSSVLMRVNAARPKIIRCHQAMLWRHNGEIVDRSIIYLNSSDPEVLRLKTEDLRSFGNYSCYGKGGTLLQSFRVYGEKCKALKVEHPMYTKVNSRGNVMGGSYYGQFYEFVCKDNKTLSHQNILLCDKHSSGQFYWTHQLPHCKENKKYNQVKSEENNIKLGNSASTFELFSLLYICQSLLFLFYVR